MTKKLLTINLEDLVDLVFFIYSESDDFDIGSPSATAFPADLEEGDCGEEKIECGSVESESDKSDVPTSNDEDNTEDLTADDLISCTV